MAVISRRMLSASRILHAAMRYGGSNAAASLMQSGTVAQAHVGRHLEGAPHEATRAVCRGIGPIAAEFHCALAREPNAEN
eukprot:3420236-Pyramimonas_sp.AAC.1